ncbi:hypothetical protein BD769DRAFT_1392340 [Suillus cothurnatus]|nr:hypothetical protein BD769DRAFT_1392340 [Suillus cothurnatus]
MPSTTSQVFTGPPFGLIQCVESLMSFEDKDLLAAINRTKHGMTPVERHAELVHAVSLYQKSLLGIVYSDDWLNMRTTISIYRQLGKWFETIDAEYAIAHPELLTAISTPNPALETGTDIEETPPQSSTTSFASTNSSYVTHSPFPSPAHTSMQDVTFPPSNATPPPTHPYLPSPSIDPHFCSGVYLGLGFYSCNSRYVHAPQPLAY